MVPNSHSMDSCLCALAHLDFWCHWAEVSRHSAQGVEGWQSFPITPSWASWEPQNRLSIYLLYEEVSSSVERLCSSSPTPYPQNSHELCPGAGLPSTQVYTLAIWQWWTVLCSVVLSSYTETPTVLNKPQGHSRVWVLLSCTHPPGTQVGRRVCGPGAYRTSLN